MTTRRKTGKKPSANATVPVPTEKIPNIVAMEGHQYIYSNVVQIMQSLYDFKLTFGMVAGVKDGRMQIAALQTIVLSPQHAKEFAKVLTENVRAYEEGYMPLPLPSDDNEGEETAVETETVGDANV